MDQSILYCAFASAPFQTERTEGEENISTHSQLPSQLLRKKLILFMMVCVEDLVSSIRFYTLLTHCEVIAAFRQILPGNYRDKKCFNPVHSTEFTQKLHIFIKTASQQRS